MAWSTRSAHGSAPSTRGCGLEPPATASRDEGGQVVAMFADGAQARGDVLIGAGQPASV